MRHSAYIFKHLRLNPGYGKDLSNLDEESTRWSTYHCTCWLNQDYSLVTCRSDRLDLICSLNVSYVQKWDFWKVVGSWGWYSHQWANQLMNSQINVLLRVRVWLEEMSHWGHDLDRCVLLPSNSLFSFHFPAAMGWTSFITMPFHHAVSALEEVGNELHPTEPCTKMNFSSELHVVSVVLVEQQKSWLIEVVIQPLCPTNRHLWKETKQC